MAKHPTFALHLRKAWGFHDALSRAFEGARVREVVRPTRRCIILDPGPSRFAAFKKAILSYGGQRHAKRGLSGKERALMAIIRGLDRPKRGLAKKKK